MQSNVRTSSSLSLSRAIPSYLYYRRYYPHWNRYYAYRSYLSSDRCYGYEDPTTRTRSAYNDMDPGA